MCGYHVPTKRRSRVIIRERFREIGRWYRAWEYSFLQGRIPSPLIFCLSSDRPVQNSGLSGRFIIPLFSRSFDLWFIVPQGAGYASPPPPPPPRSSELLLPCWRIASLPRRSRSEKIVHLQSENHSARVSWCRLRTCVSTFTCLIYIYSMIEINSMPIITILFEDCKFSFHFRKHCICAFQFHLYIWLRVPFHENASLIRKLLFCKCFSSIIMMHGNFFSKI